MTGIQRWFLPPSLRLLARERSTNQLHVILTTSRVGEDQLLAEKLN